MTGQLKRTTMKQINEELVLLRALKDMNSPKLISDDRILFQSLLDDLFPHVLAPSIVHDQLFEKIEHCLRKNNFIIVQQQIEKMIQLFQTMNNRHSTMLVGSTRFDRKQKNSIDFFSLRSSTGKTVAINTLAEVQTEMGTKTTLFIVNPKALTVVELYGVLDPLTRTHFIIANRSVTFFDRR